MYIDFIYEELFMNIKNIVYIVNIVLFFIILFSCNKKIYFIPQDYKIKSPQYTARTYWPTTHWRKKLVEDKISIKKLEDIAFPKYNSSILEEERVITNALLIIKNAHIIYERYENGFNQNSSHVLWSISKSITNALYGIAIQKQYIQSVDDTVAKYYPPYSFKKKNFITFRHFLNMNSGLKWKEAYEDDPFFSHTVAILYTFGRNETGRFFSQIKTRYVPGEYHFYSTGTTTFLMFLLQKILGEKYQDFAWEELYNILGMSHVVMETDSKAKTFYGGNYIYASARDLAKFAFLYLNNGIWEEKQILPKDWVNFSRTPPKSKFHYDKEKPTENMVYGAHWWTNFSFRGKRPLKDAPEDTFFGKGHWGQYMFIIPSLDLIIIRFGNDRINIIDKNLLFKYSMELSKQ